MTNRTTVTEGQRPLIALVERRQVTSLQTASLQAQGRIQDLRKGGGPWRARGARAYNGGLGAEPPAGSRGRAPSLFGHFYTKEGPNVKHLNEMI